MALLVGPSRAGRHRKKLGRRLRLRSSLTRITELFAYRLRHEELEPRRLLTCDAPLTPVLCLTTEQGITFDSGTGEVSQWSDQSGQGNDLFAAGSERPLVGSTFAPSGLDAISFDGEYQRLLRTLTDSGGINGLPDGNLDRSFFVVAQFSRRGRPGRRCLRHRDGQRRLSA